TNARLRTLIGDIARVKPTLQLEEQAVNPLRTGLFLRAGRIDRGGGRLRDVTIFDLAGQDLRRVVYADSGVMGLAPDGRDLVLRLYDGEVHEYRTSAATLFQLTAFGENTVVVRGVANELERDEFEGARGDREMSTCEMLDVVATSRARQSAGGDWGEAMVTADLRRLLGLRAAPPTQPVPPELSAGGYCALLRRVKQALTPRTADAQEPAQRPAPRKRLPGPPDRFRRPADGERPGPARGEPGWGGAAQAGGGPAAAPALGPGPEGAGGPAGARGIRLASPAELAEARETALAARHEASEFLLEVHKKWSLSVACLVFVLLGVPLALRFPRGGMGLVLGGTGICVAVFYICLPAGEALADTGQLHPAIPMWAPNVLYACLGLLGLWVVNRESGSTRGGDLAELAAPFLRLARRLRGRRGAAA
ncbi:MAG TPA: LptF/LptG family permease, partial [Gemmatimonadales bacterium]|nr:LptF/LptG family permease [Gemmatimonadales bacterium]